MDFLERKTTWFNKKKCNRKKKKHEPRYELVLNIAVKFVEKVLFYLNSMNGKRARSFKIVANRRSNCVLAQTHKQMNHSSRTTFNFCNFTVFIGHSKYDKTDNNFKFYCYVFHPFFIRYRIFASDYKNFIFFHSKIDDILEVNCVSFLIHFGCIFMIFSDVNGDRVLFLKDKNKTQFQMIINVNSSHFMV